jgi:hypothetical protein
MAGLVMRGLPIAVSLAAVALPLLAMPWHAGSPGIYLLSVATWAAFAALAVPRPRSVVYTTLVVMWSLGFPLKLALHLLVDYPYQEPIGDFAGTRAQWDAVLAVVSCGMAGAGLARVISLRWPSMSLGASVPRWYARAPALVWVLTGLALLVSAVLNWRLSLYQIGVHPVMTLPWRGHLVVAWTVALGGGLLVAALVDWERARDRGASPAASMRLMAAIGAEATMASTSALSRGIVLFRLVPYWVSFAHRVRDSLVGTPHAALRFAAVGAAAMVVAIALVSLDRAHRFTAAAHEALTAAAQEARPTAPPEAEASATHPDAPPAAPGSAAPVPPRPTPGVVIAVQLRNLLVDRWVGLEGVMAVTAAPVRPGVVEVLREPPTAGVDAWFQRLSRAPYLRMEGFTFLTLPGPLALCATTGSLTVVASVTLAIVLLLLGVEWGILRIWRAPHLPAMAGVALANYFVQMNVPYLWLVSLVQLLATIAALVVLQEARVPGARRAR